MKGGIKGGRNRSASELGEIMATGGAARQYIHPNKDLTFGNEPIIKRCASTGILSDAIQYYWLRHASQQALI